MTLLPASILLDDLDSLLHLACQVTQTGHRVDNLTVNREPGKDGEVTLLLPVGPLLFFGVAAWRAVDEGGNPGS